MTCHTNECVRSRSVNLHWFTSKTNMQLFENSKHQYNNKTKYFPESFNTLEVKKITDYPCFQDLTYETKILSFNLQTQLT